MLLVVKPTYRGRWGRYWLYRCDCGNSNEVLGSSLPKVKSCGCLRRKGTHGLSRVGKRAKVYSIWHAMIQRCRNKRNVQYKNYGGRGIAVCQRWSNILNFIKDMGHPAPKMTLERVDNNKGYSPGNCRWATQAEQARNKRGVRLITWNGKIKCLTDWAKELKLSHNGLKKRLRHRSFEDAVKRPFGGGRFITFKGETKNLNAWAKKLGLEAGTISMRINKGWSIERAFEVRDKRKVFISFDGHTRSIADWARKVGLSGSTLQNRLKKGWSVKRALYERLQGK